MNALTVKNLTKEYPSFKLNGVSFGVGVGRIVGLIGRNGAGKSTTLKGILNLISATGEVEVFGREFSSDEAQAKALIGYVGGGFRYYPLKKLRAVASCVASFYSAWDWGRYAQLMAEFALDENKKISELSEGMKVKFSVVLALSRGAKLLVMDEPTSGLDPLSREEFCELILTLVKEQEISVLFSTHITTDLEKIADDVVYLSDGEVLANEPLSSLVSRYRVASFATKEQATACGVPVYGVKAVKNGFEGLVNADTLPTGVACREASLEQVMVYLEREASYVKAN